jgi:hypothetical protein
VESDQNCSREVLSSGSHCPIRESIGIAFAGLDRSANPTQTIQGEGQTIGRRIGQMFPECADDLASSPTTTRQEDPGRRSATGSSLAKRLMFARR